MDSKLCNKCGTVKSFTEFGKNRNLKYGLQPYCKKCRSEQMKEYSKTTIGLITKIYALQRHNSKTRNHNMPTYTKEELAKWIKNNTNFDRLYSNWKRSNYNKDLTPSVDRLDNSIGYSIDNIQLVTWKKNRENGNRDVSNDVIKGICKKVNKYDLDFNFIRSYVSTVRASADSGVNRFCIRNVCNLKQKSAGGFIWRFDV